MSLMFALLFFGPSALGFLLLLVSCLFARRLSPVVAASIAAVLLHLVSVLILFVAMRYGEAWSGQGSAHTFPATYGFSGFAVIAVLVAVKRKFITVHSSKSAA